jgi:hypothetical protein
MITNALDKWINRVYNKVNINFVKCCDGDGAGKPIQRAVVRCETVKAVLFSYHP